MKEIDLEQERIGLEKEGFFFLKMFNGELFIHRGYKVNDTVEARNLYAIQMRPQETGMYAAIARLDSAFFFDAASEPIYINPAHVMLSTKLKPDCQMIEQIHDTDKQMDAAKSGILLPNQQNMTPPPNFKN